MCAFLIGGLIIALLVITWISSARSTVAQTQSGGITVTGTPNAAMPLKQTGTSAIITSATIVTQLLAKKIIILRDSAEHTIGEVHAYNDAGQLNVSDFSSAELFPGMSRLTLTLKNPTRLTRVDVLNRQDHGVERSANAIVILQDIHGNEIFRETLAGARKVQLFPVVNAF